MKKLFKRIAALVVAPAAVSTGMTASAHAWDAASAEGSVEAYAKLALDHPEFAEEAREAIVEANERIAMIGDAEEDGRGTAASDMFRDIQII